MNERASTSELRDGALMMFQAAIDRADPALALRREWAAHPLQHLEEGGQNIILALGKAAIPMAKEALAQLPNICATLAVTNAENATALNGARVMIGAHPTPDESSAAAGRAIKELLQTAGAGDRVMALISGGGSALTISPQGQISVDDYGRTNALLLENGLDIKDINLIRQQIDALKGGGWLSLAAPARVESFILSDVIGDDLRAIASGPTVSPLGDHLDAIRILKSAGIWEKLPKTVRDALQAPRPNLEPTETRKAKNTLIGSNRQSLDAMVKVAPAGFDVQIVNDQLVGDVGDAAREIVMAARRSTVPSALIFGGETTVELRGDGLGGRNQELALRVAIEAGDLGGSWVFLSGGTDGRDGPTDAAGGIVDAGTLARIQAHGASVDALLEQNGSHAALRLAGDLVRTGGTGTNVADVQVFLRARSEEV